MNIRESILGRIGQTDIKEIILEDPGHIRVHILSYGAAIWKLYLPDRERAGLCNVVLGFEDWHDYLGNSLYAGAALCPTAGRISQGSLIIGGRQANLTANDGSSSLHGGKGCGSHRPWKVTDISRCSECCSVNLSLTLPDQADGFPGNREITIRYTLRNDHSLKITFYGTSDEAAYLNLSNHSYFNLSGDFSHSGLEQELTVCARRYIANDSGHLPVSIEACADTPFDFTRPAPMIENMKKWPKDRQLTNANGYNNGFLLDSPSEPRKAGLKQGALLRDLSSGRAVTLFTDAPCLVVYSGGYIGSQWKLSSGPFSSNSCAIALEAQDIPDAGRFAPEAIRILQPGELYTRNIRLEFQW